MASKSKRKHGEIDAEQIKYKIAVLPIKIGKNPLYIDCQKTSERVIPPASSSTLWFSYDYKRYHPFSLINSEGNHCHKKDIKLQLKLELLENASNPNIPLPEPTLTVATSSGTSECYWFSVVRPHVAGRYRFEIFGVKDAPVEPLIWEMIVTDSTPRLPPPSPPIQVSSVTLAVPIIPISTSSPATTQELTVTNEDFAGSNIGDISSIATVTEVIDHENSVKAETENLNTAIISVLPAKLSSPSTLEPSVLNSSEPSTTAEFADTEATSTKKAPIAIPPPTDKIIIKSLFKAPRNVSVTAAISKPPPNFSKSTSDKETPIVMSKQKSQSSSSPGSILSPDYYLSGKKENGRNLSVSERLVLNPFPAPDVIADGAYKKIVRPGVSELKLDGLVIKLTIPPALVVALLDDKSRVSMYQTEATHSHIPSPHRRAFNEELAKQTLRYSQPTVHEILFKVQKDTKTIVDGVETFRLLRHAFEYYFDRCVLYAVERTDEVYGDILKQLRQSKKSCSGSFGAIFLLRFIVFLASGLESVLDHSEELSDQETMQGDVDGVTATIGGNSGISSASQITQISQSRRRLQNSRHIVGSATKLQEVAVLLLKELEFGSHFIFQ